MAKYWGLDNELIEFADEIKIPEPRVTHLSEMFSCLADEVAFHCGDTFIESRFMSPCAQWQRIMRMLDSEGFKIVKKFC